MGFSPELIEFCTENYYHIFTSTSFLNFCLIPNFLDIVYNNDVTIAVTCDDINTNKLVIYQRTCLPSCYIPCILLLSMALNS